MKIQWISYDEMEITCGPKYTIRLEPVTRRIRVVSNECLFSGSIQGDEKSYVAVWGCIGKRTIVSIASKLVENGQIDLEASNF